MPRFGAAAARLPAAATSYVVVAGQLARFTGTDQLNHEIDQIPNRDDFDNFAFQRDEREDHSESANYISPEMTGASDLDEYGHWRYVADYGPVWTPVAVAPGMGSLSLRPLGLGRALGMDLG